MWCCVIHKLRFMIFSDSAYIALIVSESTTSTAPKNNTYLPDAKLRVSNKLYVHLVKHLLSLNFKSEIIFEKIELY